MRRRTPHFLILFLTTLWLGPLQAACLCHSATKPLVEKEQSSDCPHHAKNSTEPQVKKANSMDTTTGVPHLSCCKNGDKKDSVLHLSQEDSASHLSLLAQGTALVMPRVSGLKGTLSFYPPWSKSREDIPLFIKHRALLN